MIKLLRTRVGLVILAFVAAQPLEAQMSSATIPADVLPHIEVGGGAATIVLLHGGPGLRHDYLRPEWEPLSEKFRLIFYDQRGCGIAPRTGAYTIAQHLADLHALLQEVSPGHPVVLAGTSWGAWLALAYTLEHPDRVAGVVLTGVTPWPVVGKDSTYESLDRNRQARVDSLLAGLPGVAQARMDSATTAQVFAGANPQIAARLGEFCPDANLAMRVALRDLPPLERLRQIRAPVLLVRGTINGVWQDGSGSTARVLSSPVVITLPGAGHDPWFDQPEAFRSIVAEFIQHIQP